MGNWTSCSHVNLELLSNKQNKNTLILFVEHRCANWSRGSLYEGFSSYPKQWMALCVTCVIASTICHLGIVPCYFRSTHTSDWKFELVGAVWWLSVTYNFCLRVAARKTVLSDPFPRVTFCGAGTLLLFVWLLNAPAACSCISRTYLHRQLHVLLHLDRSCLSNFLSHPVAVYWHRASLYDTKDEFYDPVASSLQGQVFQGGCHQQEVVEGGGGGERGEVVVGD